MDYSLPGSSVHGISQNIGNLNGFPVFRLYKNGFPVFQYIKILEWVVTSFCRGPSSPRDWTCIYCIADRFFATGPSGKPTNYPSRYKMPNDPALAVIGWGEGESPSASFTGESWGYAGFLFCCCQITPHGPGPQLCPSQFLCLCVSTTSSLKCLLLFLIQSSVHLIPGLRLLPNQVWDGSGREGTSGLLSLSSPSRSRLGFDMCS